MNSERDAKSVAASKRHSNSHEALRSFVVVQRKQENTLERCKRSFHTRRIRRPRTPLVLRRPAHDAGIQLNAFAAYGACPYDVPGTRVPSCPDFLGRRQYE